MDPEEKRIRELMADLDTFCFNHREADGNCEGCPFHTDATCPLHGFLLDCLSAIYNGGRNHT